MDRIDNLEAISRFLSHIKQCDETGCWLWQGGTDGRKGYGRFKIDGRVRAAHRVSFAMFIGELPDGATVDHTCYTPACVCPSHLQPMGLVENSQNTRPRNNGTPDDGDDCPY